MNKSVLLTVFVVLNNCGFVNSTTEQSEQKRVEQIVNEKVTEFVKKPEFSSLSGAIYVDGKSYQFHFGRLIDGKQANNETIYEIGSVTKTYTGLLLSQAVYDKKLALNDDIRNYLEGDYPNLVLAPNTPITIRNLITHTSGLPLTMNCNEGAQTVNEQITCFETFTKEDFFEELNKIKPIENSGKNYHYSGVGIQLVGYILERVYRLSFQELLEDHVFSRFSKKEILWDLKYEENSNISIGKDNSGVSMPLINGFYEYAGGSKASTSSMLNYIQMYLESDDPVVKQAINLLAGNNQYGRAFAWNTYNYGTTKKMLYHNGSTFGHTSWVALYPNQKMGIFLVTNVVTTDSQSNLNDLSNEIIDELLTLLSH